MKQELLSPAVATLENEPGMIPAELTFHQKNLLLLDAFYDLESSDIQKRLRAFAVLRQPFSRHDSVNRSN